MIQYSPELNDMISHLIIQQLDPHHIFYLRWICLQYITCKGYRNIISHIKIILPNPCSRLRHQIKRLFLSDILRKIQRRAAPPRLHKIQLFSSSS